MEYTVYLSPFSSQRLRRPMIKGMRGNIDSGQVTLGGHYRNKIRIPLWVFEIFGRVKIVKQKKTKDKAVVIVFVLYRTIVVLIMSTGQIPVV
ncbi:predicted protein [Sclerotinia sclerotiorum 1980 UF-70]|uniref:Uncharacterized protein n=1 Tax=Sclerotinia sclerotiorum (strain ATCC 18683 / 1980 / Ss-1) TaxID=665079 RepID=A7F8K1_SCLS1|nr:predicted protein [Sclerotinia sclerotiorum 1980 UF-70]EDN99072.1 predicted protein [Sclerotinia sclerotiorum 1980 UF-70]